jgi:hypothetical protein
LNRKVALVLIGGALAGVLVGVALAGGDEGSDREPRLPDLGIPRTTEPPAGETGATGPTEPDTTTSPDTGAGDGTGGDTGGAPASAPADTETNDVPPPRGSPAERFEFCQDNPGAC